MLDYVLLPWSDLVLMGIVSKNFPLPEFCHSSGSVCFDSVDAACEPLLVKFADVFSDKLNGQHIAGEHMKIEMRSDIPIDPIHISTTQKGSIAFRKII